MEQDLTRRIPPKPGLSISKSSVVLGVIGFGLIIAFSIVTRKRPNEFKEAAVTETKASPGYAISSLPNSYADLPPLPKPKLKETPKENNADAELQKLLVTLIREREKRALDARKSAISFSNTSVSNSSPKSDSSFPKENSTSPEGREGNINPRDEANRQDDKIAFLNSNRGGSDGYLHDTLSKPVSRYEVKAGAIIPGLLLSGLNSDLPGQILGQVSENVYDTVSGNYLLIPRGTKVIGSYDSRIVYGQERLLVAWNRLIYPNGSSISLEGMEGTDPSGYAGMSDQVNNHYLRLAGGIVLTSLLGATSQISQGREYNSINPSYSALATQGAAQNLNEVGQQITRKNLDVQPTLEIRPGYRFNIFVNKDMILEPTN